MTLAYLCIQDRTVAIDVPDSERIADLIADLRGIGIEAREVERPISVAEIVGDTPSLRDVLASLPSIVVDPPKKPRSPLGTVAAMAGVAAAFGGSVALPSLPRPKPPRLTDADRIRKAEEKRQRRASKRVAK